MKLKNEMFTIIGGDEDHVRIKLNPLHTIYQAHFPGTPITPGVCIVQIIGELLGERIGRQVVLSRITNLKFNSTISPVDDPVVEVNFTQVEPSEAACTVKGTITAGEEVKTKYSLVYNMKD